MNLFHRLVDHLGRVGNVLGLMARGETVTGQKLKMMTGQEFGRPVSSPLRSYSNHVTAKGKWGGEEEGEGLVVWTGASLRYSSRVKFGGIAGAGKRGELG